ncbi:I23O2 dioxygenase, partial [Polypterus senegalus]
MGKKKGKQSDNASGSAVGAMANTREELRRGLTSPEKPPGSNDPSKMPLLDTKYLNGYKEQRLAHLALSFITMGYVWQEGEQGSIKALPQNLAIPFWNVSQCLGLPAILVHGDSALANWKKKDPNGMQDYMPPSHRQLIQDIASSPSLQQYIVDSRKPKLQEAFNNCVSQLVKLRNQHIIIVTNFILVPAAKARDIRKKATSNDNILLKAPSALEERGTGGSGIMSFLKSVRDTTKVVCVPSAH